MKNAALGIVFNETRTEILLIKRRDVPIWVFPGGGIDEGETPEVTVVREVLEETGVQVKIIRKVAEYTPLNRLTSFTTVFECQVVGGSLTTSDETTAVGFYKIGSLPKPFLHVHKDWLDDALSGASEVIRKPIHQITYWNVIKYFFRHPVRIIRTIAARWKQKGTTGT